MAPQSQFQANPDQGPDGGRIRRFTRAVARVFGRRGPKPPDALDWRGYGKPSQELSGVTGVGFETPGRIKVAATKNGDKYGSVRVPSRSALGDAAAPNRFTKGASGVRIAAIKEDAMRAAVSPAQRVATAPARRRAKQALKSVLQLRLAMLTDSKLPEAKDEAAKRRERLAAEREKFEALPRCVQGYFDSRLLLGAFEIFVVVFDAFVIHGALEWAGVSQATAWGTSVTLPLAILTANHVFGMLAGAIGLKAPRESRLKLAGVTFTAGVAALMSAFLTLMVFRSEAIEAQNDALRNVAKGAADTRLDFFLSPTWMGPVQIAGSIAAIVCVALWTMAKEGRQQQQAILRREQELRDAGDQVAHWETEIATTRREVEMATVAMHEIEADAAAAQVEVDANEDILETQIEAEKALADAVTAEYETHYTYVEQLYANGGVVRCAMPTVDAWRGKRTPPPQDTKGDPAHPSTPPDSGRNGRGHAAPNHLNPLS